MAAGGENFGFLAHYDPQLARLAERAEFNFAEDPNTCLVKLRQFGELLVQHVAARFGIAEQETFGGFIHCLRRQGVTPDVIRGFDELRHAGNEAVHGFTGDHREALHKLKVARGLAIWFHRIQGHRDFNPGPFVPPPDPQQESAELRALLEQAREELRAASEARQNAELAAEEAVQYRVRAEAEAARIAAEAEIWQGLAQETEAQLEAEKQRTLALLNQARAEAETAPALAIKAQAAVVPLELDEAATREFIDRQLREAGWEVDSRQLTHAEGARPQKGKSLAIAEWPTARGPADYALFLGLRPVGVVEAKRRNKDVSASLEQAKRYSRNFDPEPEETWGDYRVPFLFATNGRPFLRQIQEKSGIWFLDARKPTNKARALEGWYTPAVLEKLLAQDVEAAHAKLKKEPTHYLGLRDYQVAAIHAVESAIEAGQDHILVAMATGTGKTKTCIGLVYRLLKTGRFRRILFLVDRTTLGEQSYNAFEHFRLEQNQTFTETYDVKSLADVVPDESTRVHVATIQATIRRALEGEPQAPIDQYDCIIVDECHRGYTLDRELSEAEFLYRNEQEYISQYRRALDHFDAVRIGLTATPALHTVQIFGEPVYLYSYRQAVIDGYLVDHEPPLQIVTNLAQHGMKWEAHSEMLVLDAQTQQLDTVHLEDEVTLELEKFNRVVLTDNFNRAVCAELARHIDPTLPGKTLVFCATDLHADMVVRLLKETFEDLPDDGVVKITGAADRPSELLRRFRNEQYPSIAVTVDLLTTGVDVPQITNLVFLRRVKSRILYQQMIGRATRLCAEIGKECFQIFDAVELYADMEEFSDMKPVVVNPTITFQQLVRELGEVPDGEKPRILEQLLAKLQRKKRVLKDGAELEQLAGMELQQVVRELKTMSPGQVAEWFAQRPSLAQFLDTVTGGGTNLIVSTHEDEVISTSQGFGPGNQAPEDYLEGFARFVQEKMNEIPALIVVTQRPRELTREALREVKLILDQAGYSEIQLRKAYRSVTHQDLAATIIGFIRQKALGSPLMPYAERVERATQKILASHPWTERQRQWLLRIARQLQLEVIVDRQALEQGEFGARGGFQRLNKELDGRLEQLLGDLQQAIWEDVA